MAAGYAALTEKEKETLLLMAFGHDAKSMARELSLSVHTINDRLRAARRKLGVTSSREAARLVLAREGSGPQNYVPKDLGGASGPPYAEHTCRASDEVSPARGRKPIAVIGGTIVASALLIALLLALQAPSFTATATTTAETGAATGRPESAKLEEAETFARLWLDLADREGFEARRNAADSVGQNDPNLAGWNAILDRRERFGTALEREAQRIDIVHSNGRDRWIVIFRTDFERLKGAYEKVTLTYKDGAFITRDYTVD